MHDTEYYDSLAVTYQVLPVETVTLSAIDKWLEELQSQVIEVETRQRKRFNQNMFAQAVTNTIRTAYSS